MALPIPPDALKQHIADVGKTGAGKTYVAKAIAEGLLDEGRRVCVIDPTGVWYGLKSSADGKAPGYPVVVFGGEHADVPIAEASATKLASIVATHNVPAIIDLSEFSMNEKHRFMEHFAGTLYKLNKTPLHLIIDEADEFAPQNPLPESRRMLNHIDRIVRRGRVKGFRVMLISQRPAVIHKNVLTQANTMIAMRLTAPQDRKAVEEWVKGNADADQAKEVLGSLARLSTGEGWVWSPEHGVLERVQFPLIKTFDSGRTPDDDDELLEPETLADVDVSELKSLLDEPAPGVPTKGATKPTSKTLEAEYRRGFADGEKVGRRAAHASIGQQIAFVADGIVEKIDELRRLPDRPVATEAPRPRLTARSERKAPADGSLTSGAIKLLQALAQRHPVAMTWVQICTLAGVKARGGHFNSNRKALSDGGHIDDNGGLVSLTDLGLEAATAQQLSQYILNLGYDAVASMNDTALVVPYAVQAGLGEYGRNQMVITPEFGPRVRFSKIFTSLPLVADQPRRFGVREFCDICSRCADACPPKALPYGPPSFDTPNRSAITGVKKWTADCEKCFGYWAKLKSDCAICLRVCPWNRDYSHWPARLFRRLAGGPLRRVALWLDGRLNLGRRRRPNDWWQGLAEPDTDAPIRRP